MKSDKYILRGDKIEQADNLIDWAIWFESANRTIERTDIDDVCVSTVFLGIDHSFTDRPPILFETMIFGGPHDGYQDRYETMDDAKAGHAKACKLAFTPVLK